MSASTLSPLPTSRILHTWWPLAASWLFMATELPIVSAVIARLPNAEINLAAYGGIVFPVALIVESPIIMLLAASTALSKDWDSYAKMRRWMMRTSAALTALHLLIAFTPLYDFVVEKLIGAPAEIVEAGRIGLMIMTPWTWAIAYRRVDPVRSVAGSRRRHGDPADDGSRDVGDRLCHRNPARHRRRHERHCRRCNL
jgi:hypothetical protein